MQLIFGSRFGPDGNGWVADAEDRNSAEFNLSGGKDAVLYVSVGDRHEQHEILLTRDEMRRLKNMLEVEFGERKATPDYK